MTSFNTSTYDIERPTGVCVVTGRRMEPGENFIAALVEEGEGLKRLDISTAAWDEGRRPDRMLAFWQTTVPEPNEKKKVFVDDEVLMNLLRRLEDAEQPQRIAFRFVLMLILMRKKLLRYDKTERRAIPAGVAASAATASEDSSADQPPTTEADWWLLTPKLDLSKGPLGKWKEEETIAVMDPHLDDERIRQVGEQIGEILNAEL